MHKWLRKKFMWNFMIRFYMQQYFTLALSSFINLHRVREILTDLFSIQTYPDGDLMATLMSMPCLILVISGPPFFTFWLSKNREKILEEDEEFISMYGTLIESLRVQEGWVQMNYKVL